MQKYLIIMLLGLFLLSGCSSAIYYRTSGVKMVTPEAPNRSLSGSFGLTLSNPLIVTTIRDMTTVPPIDSGSSVELSEDETDIVDLRGFDFSIGIVDKLEFSWALHEGMDFGRIKYQFLGSSRNERAKGFVLSGVVGYGGHSKEETSTSSSFVPSSVNSYKLTVSAFEAMVLAGYRLNSYFLPYITISHTDTDVKTEITQTSNITYNYEDSSEHLVAGIGLQLNASDSFFFVFEWAYNELKYPRTTTTKVGGWGANASFAW